MNKALSETEAEEIIFSTGFDREQVGRIGTELEWIVLDPRDLHRRIAVKELVSLLDTERAALPGGSLISFQPGGQLELSTRPFGNLADCINAARTDTHAVESRLASAGLILYGTGLDPRKPQMMTEHPRHAALESHYSHFGSMGRLMLANSASIQINVDAGDATDGWRGRSRRWLLANCLGPLLTAIFANSAGPPSSPARSRRQVIRFQTDPTRTDPMALDIDPRRAWARYAMDALVVGIPEHPPRPWSPPPRGLTMRGWLRDADLRTATIHDLVRHVKTVIPPVRPCGYLEIRMVDSQPGQGWVVPLAVVAALLDDARASDETFELVSRQPIPDRRDIWVTAARRGLLNPRLATAARECLRIAIDALARLSAPPWVCEAVERFAVTYTYRGRCPADDPQTLDWP
ncbi:glutamate--cysteine ligase EgtA [Rhizocola hellebori]|uniref:Glutamate--cysteine ligase EgtA n=1 Tax=Rhizocola hellebori TaxID=1392758 RepID=A0A8J3VEU5_9ACTN|nr:glutamate-cysteine ligase family protein [Rhizocola hellebori]GIH03328.1 glutamate--cysteine ligase EgtA [Rhizocola hellebori]